ncbi:hypothetical protein RUM44_009982 [Polyplax serrata]|uniref:Uncharacterized protein n=1 Tax=Polyplax serrata TaxID=468196 RepID=A0ABR1AU81_POLSC
MELTRLARCDGSQKFLDSRKCFSTTAGFRTTCVYLHRSNHRVFHLELLKFLLSGSHCNSTFLITSYKLKSSVRPGRGNGTYHQYIGYLPVSRSRITQKEPTCVWIAPTVRYSYETTGTGSWTFSRVGSLGSRKEQDGSRAEPPWFEQEFLLTGCRSGSRALWLTGSGKLLIDFFSSRGTPLRKQRKPRAEGREPALIEYFT